MVIFSGHLVPVWQEVVQGYNMGNFGACYQETCRIPTLIVLPWLPGSTSEGGVGKENWRGTCPTTSPCSWSVRCGEQFWDISTGSIG